MNSNHQAKVVKIAAEDFKVHPNADKLELIFVGGYQVVTQKGQFKPGDLAVYIQPDSVVPARSEFSFLWEKDGGGNLRVISPEMEIPESWRRVTVRKFRKEWSEGLLLPVRDFIDSRTFTYDQAFIEGNDVSERLGITHYNPPEPEELDRGTSIRQSRTRPRSFKGWVYFLKNWSLRILSFGQHDPWGNCGGSNEKAPKNTPPIYDVETFKNYKGVFEPGEEVIVTEKIHGSNARFLYQPSDLGFGGKMYAGSRKLWKSAKSNCVWRHALAQNPWIENWCREHPGYTLYGEVVPTQGGFNYGTDPGQVKFFVFDILTPTEGWINVLDYWQAAPGEWAEKRINLLGQELVGGLIWVPVLYCGAFDETKIKTYVDGASNVRMSNHIREGIVIKSVVEKEIRGLGRAQLKIVSNKYLEKAAA